MKEYEDYVDRENKEYEKQQKDVQKQSSHSLPSPNYGGFKVPKIDIPKFDLPKM